MCKKPVLLLSFVLCYLPGIAQVKIPTQHFQELLLGKRYSALFNEARKLREQEYGKCAMVDYFIGKCLCGSGKEDVASIWYANILKNYKGMSVPQKNLIRQAMKSCATEADGRAVASSRRVLDMSAYVAAVNAEGPSAGVSGKIGRVYKPCQTAPQPISIVKKVGADELESRLFGINQKKEAVAKYRALLGSDYTVTASSHFIFITFQSSSLTDEEVASVSAKLDIAYKFFVSNFGLRLPDKLLAVYLLRERMHEYNGDEEPNVLQQTAERVHGIKIPDENIGYSNVRDLSLVGIANPARVGTLFHELMHLIIRTDIGDVPPWMDEGLACIYETSIIEGDSLTGSLYNWRTSVLEQETHKRKSSVPQLRDFLTHSWSKFDGIDDSDICLTAINYAYAKHLLLYLQGQNQLKPVFDALKHRAVLSEDQVLSIKTDIQILEETLGGSIDEIQNQFDVWMKTNFQFSLYDVDPAVTSETFLEVWNQYSQKAQHFSALEKNDSKREAWQEFVDVLVVLKSRYDMLAPPQVEPPPGTVEQQIQQIPQPSIQAGIKELPDHYTIAMREKKMPGMQELKHELQEVIKRYDQLAAK